MNNITIIQFRATALEKVIQAGADWVEIDVQETGDGEVVVIHDQDLKNVGG